MKISLNFFLIFKKLKRSEKLDRRIGWKEVLQRVFGIIDHFPNREELLQEECDKFISFYKPESKYVPYITNYLRAYIIDENFRKIIDKREFANLHHSTVFTMEEFKALNRNTPWQGKIPEYVKTYVNLNTFME